MTWGDRLKRVSSTVLLGVVLGVLFAVLAYRLVDSPKERLLKEDIAQYRRELATLNRSVDRCNKVLADIEERDSAVYRTIFGALPVAESQRRPVPKDYGRLDGRAGSHLIALTSQRVDTLENRLYAQSVSLDEVFKMAGTKQELLKKQMRS